MIEMGIYVTLGFIFIGFIVGQIVELLINKGK